VDLKEVPNHLFASETHHSIIKATVYCNPLKRNTLKVEIQIEAQKVSIAILMAMMIVVTLVCNKIIVRVMHLIIVMVNNKLGRE